MHIFIEKPSNLLELRFWYSHVPLTACSQFSSISVLFAPTNVQVGCGNQIPPPRITFTDVTHLHVKGVEILWVLRTLWLSSLSCQNEEMDEVFRLKEDEFLGLVHQCPYQLQSSHLYEVCHPCCGRALCPFCGTKEHKFLRKSLKPVSDLKVSLNWKPDILKLKHEIKNSL